MIEIVKFDEVHLKIFTDRSIDQELSEFFMFKVPGYKFMPSYKAGLFDGNIRLYNLNTKKLYAGLLQYVIIFAERNNYTIRIEDGISYDNNIALESIEEFATILKLASKGNNINIRDYQLEAIHKAVNENRSLLISPTSSGKSLIIYNLLRWHIAQGRKCLILCPNTSLVVQLYSDFDDYSSINGWSTENNCQKLYSGFSKEFTSNCMISTWQSINPILKKGSTGSHKGSKNVSADDWMKAFDVVIVDECLHPNTLVQTIDKKTQIKNIKVDDLVLTLNEDTNQFEYKPVVKIHKNLSVNEKKFKVNFDDGTHIIITGNHKMFSDAGWKRTDELEIGENIFCN